ncbi:MAG: hypothetical protein K9K67_07920 [Bacteriovoracaceae bacterium]|nr:hypothetical protein [Bacteriovoracaceae bacterium]
MKIFLVHFLLLVGINIEANELNDKSIRDISSLILRADGNYDVICRDGSNEIRTLQEIEDQKVCTHFSHITDDYFLSYGGIRQGTIMCDFTATVSRLNADVNGVYLTLEKKCGGTTGYFSCNDTLNCFGDLNGSKFNLSYYYNGLIELKNINSNVIGMFKTENPDPSYSRKFLKLSTFDQSQNIPQVITESNIEAGWFPLCYPYDYGYDLNNRVKFLGEAICREQGKQYLSSSKVPITDFSKEYLELTCANYSQSLSTCNLVSPNCSSNSLISVSCI